MPLELISWQVQMSWPMAQHHALFVRPCFLSRHHATLLLASSLASCFAPFVATCLAEKRTRAQTETSRQAKQARKYIKVEKQRRSSPKKYNLPLTKHCKSDEIASTSEHVAKILPNIAAVDSRGRFWGILLQSCMDKKKRVPLGAR